MEVIASAAASHRQRVVDAPGVGNRCLWVDGWGEVGVDMGNATWGSGKRCHFRKGSTECYKSVVDVAHPGRRIFGRLRTKLTEQGTTIDKNTKPADVDKWCCEKCVGRVTKSEGGEGSSGAAGVAAMGSSGGGGVSGESKEGGGEAAGESQTTSHYSSQEQYHCSSEQYMRLHKLVKCNPKAQAIPRIAFVKALRETRVGVVGDEGEDGVVGDEGEDGEDDAWQAVVRTSNVAYDAWYRTHIHTVLTAEKVFLQGSIVDRAAMLSYTRP